MSEAVKFEPVSPDNVPTSPGEMIRAARERLGLSEAKIAQQLRLDETLVKALERDDYSSMAAPLFVRGYLRNISKVLNLDAEKLVARYDKLISAHEQPQLERVNEAEEDPKINNRIIQIVSALIVVVSLVLAYLWWQSEIDNPRTDERQSSLETADDLGLGAAAVPDEIQSDYDPALTDYISSAPIADPYAAPLVIDQSSVNEFDPIAATAGFAEPETSLPEQTAPPAPLDDATEAFAESSPDPSSGISFSVTEDAWIEITDGTDKRLYFNTATAGESVNLNGTAPFKLIIGNADNVTLRYQGNVIDLGPHMRQNVARLTLDQTPGGPSPDR